MLATWSKDLFQKFESKLLSPDIFDILNQEISKFFETVGFNKILGEKENSFGSFCGESFKKGQLLYHCSDCALDETCVLCEKCFVYDVHKDHNFWYTIGSDRNGSCDCGEEDSWRNELCCPRHSSQVSSLSDFSVQNDSSDSLSFSTEILSYILESILTYCSKAKFDEDQSIIILYNDESHSFDDVIEILTSSLEITTEEASIVAKLVDSKGFCPIFSSSIKACERISRKINMSGLATSIETADVCFSIILSNELLSFVLQKALVSLQLRKDVVYWLLQVHYPQNNLETIFIFDHMLWKGFRTIFSEILNLCNSIDQNSKKMIAISYCSQYRTILNYLLKEKREPHLSITNFSVQIFTLIPVAEYVVQNSSILSDIFRTIGGILEPGYKSEVGLKFQSIRGLDYTKFSVLIHDALNILRNVKNIEPDCPFFVNSIESFIYLLSLLNHTEWHVHKTGNHVTYERDNYDNANFICYEIQKVSEEFARVCAKLDCFSIIWPVFEKIIVSSPLFSQVVANSEDIPLYKSSRKASFFGSLGWFFSSLVKELLNHEDTTIVSKNKANVPVKLVKTFMTDSLSRLIFSSEVRSGLWVRNGSIVAQQEFFYSSTVFYHLTYYPDLFNCIIASHFIEKAQFIELFLKHSCLNGYIGDFEETCGVIEQLMIILINSVSGNVPSLNTDQILINYLCSESMTKNALVKLLPDYVAEDTNFRSKLLSFASLKYFNTLGSDAKLELKPEFIEKFDPFYWAVTMDVRLKSWSNIKENPNISLKLLSDKLCSQLNLNSTKGLSAFNSCFVDIFELFSSVDSPKLEFILMLILTVLISIRSIDADDSKLKDRILRALQTIKSQNQIYPFIKNILSEFELDLKSNDREEEEEEEEDSKNGDNLTRKQSGKNQKSLLMDSFKKQRIAYIKDETIEIETNDCERCCVLCSESSYDDGNPIGIPIQLNSTSLIKFEDSGDQEIQKIVSTIRGCHHFFHKKCFNSLPQINKFRKCPLCESAMDLIIFPSKPFSRPIANISLRDQSSCPNAFSISQSAIGKHLSMFELIMHSEMRTLLKSFCYTIIVLALQPILMDSIPLHQINTLLTVKNAVLNDLIGASFPFRDNVVSLYEKVDKYFCVEILQDLESLFEICILVNDKALSRDFLVISIKRIIARHYYLCKHQSRTDRMLYIDQIYRIINLFFNVIIHDSFDKNAELFDRLKVDSPEFIKFESSDIVTFWKTLSCSQLKIITDNSFQIIDLPQRHDLFLRQFLPLKCLVCKTVPRSQAICLVCGELVCVSDLCCRTSRNEGECTSHRRKCSGSVGMFILVKNCALLLLCDSAGLVIPAPYVNCYGEHDIDLHSSSALYLNQNLYRGILQEMFLRNEIRDYVLRNMVNSRLQTSWNSL